MALQQFNQSPPIRPEPQAQLRIGDVAKLVGVATHTIRYWESEFALYLHPQRTPGNRRRYSEADLALLLHIRGLLKDQRFSIAAARLQLRDHTALSSSLVKELP
jgi:DNA-binding transcriptional MerR regulator